MNSDSKDIFNKLKALIETTDSDTIKMQYIDVMEELEEHLNNLEKEADDAAEEKSDAEVKLKEVTEELDNLLSEYELRSQSLASQNVAEECRNKAFENMARNLTLEEVEALEAHGRKLCEEKGRAYLTY